MKIFHFVFNLSSVCIVPVGKGGRVFMVVWREHTVMNGAFGVKVKVAYICVPLPPLSWRSTG